jgi:hypothetical protein
LLLLFAFAFAFCSTPFFEWLKAANPKENKRQRKKGVWIQAIIGRIRTLDLDPGHFGPDFDSGSGLESVFTDPSPCAALTHSRMIDFLRIFS